MRPLFYRALPIAFALLCGVIYVYVLYGSMKDDSKRTSSHKNVSFLVKTKKISIKAKRF